VARASSRSFKVAASSRKTMKQVRSNNAFERTAKHHGPRLAAARSSWPAAQRDR
jgi:hypothetical protein